MNLSPSALARFRLVVVCQAPTNPPGFRSYSMSKDRSHGLGPSSRAQLPFDPLVYAATPRMPPPAICHRSAPLFLPPAAEVAPPVAGVLADSLGCRMQDARAGRHKHASVGIRNESLFVESCLPSVFID